MTVPRMVMAVALAISTLFLGQSPASATLTLPHFAAHVIMVEDHTTSARWHLEIAGAVRNWDTGTDVSIRSGKCVPSYGCVRVWEAWPGETGWAGDTTFNVSAAGHMYPAKIVLNDSYYALLSTHEHRQTVMHELGHSFGLTYHSLYKSTCMYGLISDSVSMYPNAYDRSVLNYLY